MARRSRDANKLLDQVACDVSRHGPLLGLLATTFELDPDFFELDFLPTTLGLGGWDDRSMHSIVARERCLAQMHAVALFMQAQRYRGRPTTLRVDIRPAVPDGSRRLHAKIVLLVQRDLVRLLVTSANLTEPGYRLNREVGLMLGASAEQPEHAALMREGLAPLPDLLGPYWNPGAIAVLEAARERLDAWSGAAPQPRDAWLVWGGGPVPLWEQLLDRWPRNEPVEAIRIVSPFWSEERGSGPVALLLQALRERGALQAPSARGDGARLALYTEARAGLGLGGEAVFQPVLPASYEAMPFSDLGVRAYAEAVSPRVSPEEMGIHEETTRERALHAKILLLQGPQTTLAYAGSANFTRSGWGLGKSATAANIEAGIIVRGRGEAGKVLLGLVPPLSGHRVPLTGRRTGGVAEAAPAEAAAPWPVFLTGLELTPADQDPDVLDLVAHLSPEKVTGPWELLEPVAPERSLLSGAAGEQRPRLRIPLSPEQLNLLLRTRYVQVRWWGAEAACEFPVNVAHAARLQLPLSPEDSRLGEDLLLSYYQGRISFEDLFPDPARDAEDAANGAPEGAAADFSAGGSSVDTARIQSYQVRAFVEALRGIRDDLRAAAQSEPSIRLALLGPVSPVALGNEVVRAVDSGQRSAVAAAFELVEIRACLLEARTCPVPPDLADAWQATLAEADQQVRELLLLVAGKSADGIPDAFRRYEAALSRHFGARQALDAGARAANFPTGAQR